MNPDTHKQTLTLLQKGRQSILGIIFGRTTLILLLLALHFLLMFTVLMPLMEKLPGLLGGISVFTAVMLLYILNTGDNPSIKLSWSVIVGVLPVFGAMLYLYTRLEPGRRLARRIQKFTMEESASHIPDPSELMEKIRHEDKDFYNLAGYLYQAGGCPVYGNTRVKYFPLGEDKFREMLIQLEKAEKYIFLEYFAIAPSGMWDQVLEVLARKAKEEVEVRVMYDGSCAVVSFPYSYPQELAKLGIKCKMFSPFRPFLSTHYNHRDHRKILVIDGHTAFTGGINILDRYINQKTVYGHWKDTAVMVQGDAARSFTLMFLQMWNYNEKERLYAPYLLPSRPDPEAEGYVIPYGDAPLDFENVGEMVYLNLLNQAKDYVWIMTPYLILDNEMLTALTFAAKRGVDVRLILPHIPDKKYAFALAKSHYAELTAAGVKIFEYTPGFVHAKMFLCDDNQAVVGTINLDYRSLYLHYECAAYLYKVPAISDIRADFEDTLKKSQAVTPESIKNESLLTRLTGKLLKIIAPLM